MSNHAGDYSGTIWIVIGCSRIVTPAENCERIGPVKGRPEYVNEPARSQLPRKKGNLTLTPFFLLLCLLTGQPVGAVEETGGGTVFIRSVLYEEPSRVAAIVTRIAPMTRVLVQQRSGIWFKVQLQTESTESGWMRRFDVRLDNNAAAKPSEDAGQGRFLGFLGGGAKKSTTGQGSTIGIRGLDVADLKNASPDVRAVKTLASFSSTPDSAARVAEAAGLSATKADYLRQEDDSWF